MVFIDCVMREGEWAGFILFTIREHEVSGEIVVFRWGSHSIFL